MREVVAGAERDHAERHRVQPARNPRYAVDRFVQRAVAASHEKLLVTILRSSRRERGGIALAGGNDDVERAEGGTEPPTDGVEVGKRRIGARGWVDDQLRFHTAVVSNGCARVLQSTLHLFLHINSE